MVDVELYLTAPDQAVASTRRQRHHGQRRMLVARRRKRVPAEHVYIRYIVRLAVRVQHSVFRVDAHARGAALVNRPAERWATRGPGGGTTVAADWRTFGR